MTIKQLQKKFEQIPPKGAINRARRQIIVQLINQQARK